jgi:hypothetical protein
MKPFCASKMQLDGNNHRADQLAFRAANNGTESDDGRSKAGRGKNRKKQTKDEKQVLCAAAVGRHEQKQASCRLGSGAHGGPSAETERCTKVT